MHKATRKYLGRHAEPEVGAIRACPPAVWKESPLQFGHVLVIPAFSEGENLFEALRSIPFGPLGPVLVIVVVNGRLQSSEKDLEQNQRTLTQLKKRFPLKAQLSSNLPLSLHEFPVGNLLIVDRNTPPFLFPEKEGVGLARKIGCDLALSFISEGKIKSNWIHTTDADVRLPSNYFDQAEVIVGDEVSAITYPFHHDSSAEPSLSEAMTLYDTSLHYYVAGLKWAGSPYAFYTLGSTLALRASAYAEVGGFPKRRAGEDFYLLNKMAKVGKVHILSGTPIQIMARLSHRVPFGTGAALQKILKDKEKSLLFYHPKTFKDLQLWLRFISEAYEKYDKSVNSNWGSMGQTATPSSSLKALDRILRKMEAFEAMEEAASRSSDSSTFRQHMDVWFDGFRTLKLIHALRDEAYPSISWEEARATAPFITEEGIEI